MKHLSALDAMFLHLETPATPMHVGSLMLLEKPKGKGSAYTVFRDHIARRMHLAPVFSRKLAFMPMDLANPVWIDEPRAYERACEFMKIVLPRHVDRIRLYDGKEPIFRKFNIEDEIARIQARRVPLPGGGSLVIDQTEALVAIDVNSGSFRMDDNAEENAYQVNLRAAEEISRQLRLRE